MDWGAGRYERTAVGLLPAAASVVELADPRPAERVIDVGCGTGNGALLAAERGARVTGVDPAEGLLEIARARAAERTLKVSFVPGEAATLPLADASADVVLSVFGVIFAPDAGAAARELARVTAPGGRIVLSAWIPDGALFEVMKTRREALRAEGEPSGPAPFPWHDGDELSQLLGGHGFSVTLSERTIAFSGASAREFAEAELRDHPLWVTAREQLQPEEWDALRERALTIFERGNEDDSAFRVTSRYVLASALRAGDYSIAPQSDMP